MSYNKYILLSSFLLLFFISCKKDDEKSDNPVPVIEFKNVSPATVKEFTDSLVFTIHYKDGDGDLGENNADVKNLFLTDNRIGIKYEYRIQQLAPDNSAIAISGDLKIVLKNVSVTDSSSQQNASFSVYLVDRAGHSSNTVTSGNILITK